MDISEVKEQLTSTATELKSLLERQATEIKSNGEAQKETSAAIVAAEKSLDTAMQEAKGMEKRIKDLEVKSNRMSSVASNVKKSLGTAYIESKAFEQVAQNNRGNDMMVFQKSISNDPGSAGAVTQAYQNPTIFQNPERPVYIRDIVNHIPVMTDAVKIVRENVFTDAAAPQAGQLATKAESNITYSEETYAVETQAHWLPASRQILSDAPRLRGQIDGRLMYGLDLLMDAQLLFGDGTGNNFTGLMVDGNVSDVGPSAALDGTVWIDHIRTAITQCQLFEYYNITGVIVNPQDWELIETAKGSDGHYIWTSVTQGGETRLWRVPVIVTNAMTQGNFLLGDFSMGATLYDREQKSVRISESNGTDFVKNAVTLLAEERAAFAVELPKAFCKGQLTPAV